MLQFYLFFFPDINKVKAVNLVILRVEKTYMCNCGGPASKDMFPFCTLPHIKRYKECTLRMQHYATLWNIGCQASYSYCYLTIEIAYLHLAVCIPHIGLMLPLFSPIYMPHLAYVTSI